MNRMNADKTLYREPGDNARLRLKPASRFQGICMYPIHPRFKQFASTSSSTGTAPQRRRQPCFRSRYGERMDMVAHQAPGPDLKLVILCIACQEFQIYLSIFIIEEYRGEVVAALSDVMRITGGYDAGDSRNGKNDADGFSMLQEQIWGVSLIIRRLLSCGPGDQSWVICTGAGRCRLPVRQRLTLAIS